MDSDPSVLSSRSRRHRDSTDTHISLQQLDPIPMETPPAIEEDDDFDVTLAESSSSNSSTIRGSTTSGPGFSNGHGAMYYLSRIQRYSSYAMGVFTSLHLANVSLIPAVTRSVSGSETYLLMTREIYQTAITEPLLVALPVVAHVGAGIGLRLLRRQQNMRRYGSKTPGLLASLHSSSASIDSSNDARSVWPPLSYISISGYIFTIFYSAHAFMNRILPLSVEGDSSNIGLGYVAHGFARHPIVSTLAYVGLIGVACSHMVWGAAKWLGAAPSTQGWQGSGSVGVDKKTKRERRRKWLTLHGISAAVAGIWASGGLGVVSRGGISDGWLGRLYDDLYMRVGLS